MKKIMYVMILILAVGIIFVGCEIPTLPDAPETPAPNIPDPTTRPNDLAIIERITEEWASTGKVFALASPAGRANCAPCHDGAVFASPGSGGFVQDGPIEGISCQACHSGTGTQLLTSGVVDASMRQNAGTFIKENFQAGSAAMCITCHNGRRDPQTALSRFVAGQAGFTYPHYGPAALTTGRGGMHLEGVTYGTTTAHTNIPNSCVACHMPVTADGYVSHTFQADLQGCVGCHPGITDFNFNGFQDRVRQNLEIVYNAAFQASGAAELVVGGGAGFTFKRADGSTIEPRPENIDPKIFVALYNWYTVKGEGSYGVHNPAYARSLLNESYRALTGNELQW